MNPPDHRPRRITFVSVNKVRWGGSEELWSVTAAALARKGHDISVWKPVVDPTVGRIQTLRALGVPLHDPTTPPPFPRVRSRLARIFPRLAQNIFTQLRRTLIAERAELVVISQGINFEGIYLTKVCRDLGLPYALISQKADDIYWPSDSERAAMRDAFLGSVAAYFVSDHNRRLTEQQLGIRLPHGQVVHNPFQVSWEPREDWPDEAGGLRLACVGRLDVREKGQDLLLRVLAMDKWRSRPLRLSFFGEGHNALGLKELAHMLSLENISFEGFTFSPEFIWDDHHALILPSRCEGLPLVEVEAMLSGRVVVTTAVGGNAEMLVDDQTGFLAAAANVDDLDNALERAWTRRAEWRQIGQAASAAIRAQVPGDPAETFATEILRQANSLERTPARIIRPAREGADACDI